MVSGSKRPWSECGLFTAHFVNDSYPCSTTYIATINLKFRYFVYVKLVYGVNDPIITDDNEWLYFVQEPFRIPHTLGINLSLLSSD